MIGWINLYKPPGLSSFALVKQVRYLLPRKTKIGHGGTLDPLAEGVLPIAIGDATRTTDLLHLSPKEYVFEVTWGEERSTDDREGETLKTSAQRPSRSEIQEILPHFLGQIQQVPPLYSAKKLNGKRLCDLARAGHDVDLPSPSPITIHEYELLDTQRDTALFRVVCSTGTYVRSLARDMGRLLGCYGFASLIRRTQVGLLALKEALTIEKLAEHQKIGVLSEIIRPLQAVLADIPAVMVTLDQAQRLRMGQAVVLSDPVGSVGEGTVCLCLDSAQMPVAIAERSDLGVLKPKRVFNATLL
jgi:tRNA pseudouridine55 synthase